MDPEYCERENSKSLENDKVWVKEKLPARVSGGKPIRGGKEMGSVQEHREKIDLLCLGCSRNQAHVSGNLRLRVSLLEP